MAGRWGYKSLAPRGVNQASEAPDYFGFKMRRSAKQVLHELESLRNHLTHAQDIVTHDWPQIVRRDRRVEELSSAEF